MHTPFMARLRNNANNAKQLRYEIATIYLGELANIKVEFCVR